jgi:hypothetical protein
VPDVAPDCREVWLAGEFWVEVGSVVEELGALVVISTGSRVLVGLPWLHPNVKPTAAIDATIVIVLFMIFLRTSREGILPHGALRTQLISV